MTKAQLACRMERNFISGYKGSHGIQTAVFSEDDSIAKLLTGYPVPWMNCVLRFDAGGKDPNEEVAKVLKGLDQQRCSMYWFVGALTARPTKLHEALKANGLALSGGGYVGMALPAEAYSPTSPPSELAIKIVDGAKKIREWLEPFSMCFSAKGLVRSHFFQYGLKNLGDSSKEVWFTAYLDDTPIGTAAYVINCGVILVHSVATLPAFRRRGYARAVMEAAISHALNRVSLPVTLYASAQGLELYKKVGFSEVYRMTPYLLQR